MAAFRRLRNLFRRERVEHEINEELEAHLSMRMEESVAQGMTPEDARRDALLRFGNPALVRERTAESDAALGLDRLWFDVRYAWRQLRKSPGYTVTVIVTMAVGIGANTAIFSSMDAVVLRPLAVPRLDRVMVVKEMVAKQGTQGNDAQAALGNYADWVRQSRSFAELSVRTEVEKTLTGAGDSTSADAAFTTAGFFRALGVEPIEGRLYQDRECRPGHDAVVVLNYGFWKRHFGGDREVLGKTIELDQRSYTVIGVLPKSVQYPSTADVFLPLAPTPEELTDRKIHRYDVLGRLRDGVTVQQASDEMRAIAARTAAVYPVTNEGWTVRVEPLLSGINGDMTPLYYWMLMGATLFVLLVVCANVANLGFARSIGRRPEIALRGALGASRWRIARQLLAENLLLALLGAILGLGFAGLYLHLTLITMPERVARYMAGWSHVSLNARAFAFSLALAVLATLVSGFIPVADALRVSFAAQLKSGARSTTGNGRGQRLRGLFAMAQVALAVALVAGAVLMTKGMLSLLHKGDVYHPERILTFHIELPQKRYPASQKRGQFYSDTLDRLRALPGVQHAEMVNALPYSDDGWSQEVSVEDQPAMVGKAQIALHVTVSPGYFGQFRIPIVAGRVFSGGDTRETAPVALVSERFVRQYFGEADPIGHRIRMGDPRSNAPWMRIVGVVRETSYGFWDTTPIAAVYIDAAQQPEDQITYAVTTPGDPLALVPGVRRVFSAADPLLPLNTVETYDRLMKDNLTGLMYAAVMLGVDAAIALLLAAIGIYSVMAALVGERTREIGVRLAMGADRQMVVGMVLRRAARLTAVGLGTGLLLAFALAKSVATLLRGVRPDDPLVYISIAITIGLAALLSSWIPARRAAQVDPMQALRSE